MASREAGKYVRSTVAGEAVEAFVPDPLPPSDPPLQLDGELEELRQQAEGALSRLEVAAQMVPSIDWFIYAFVRKEAVLSSQIEGTQATLVNLLEFEAESDTEMDDDLEEVCNYLEALNYARDQLGRDDGLPISMRLLNETHARLMQGVRGANKRPGEVRKSQNWVGGTRAGNASYVPPPPHLLQELLSDLEHYIHGRDQLPPLVRIGLIHVHFESLHPYLDGNGRIGRLLIALLLEDWNLLTQPVLYLSLFLKQHRETYYRLLDDVRETGDWEAWLAFFLEGVEQVASEAASTSRALFDIVSEHRHKVLAAGSATLMSIRLFEQLPQHPVVTVTSVVDLLDTTRPTAGKAISVLEDTGVLVEVTGRERDRRYHYKAYMDRLREGTEL
ncbi:MAG: Fic family protein [Myxococcota bacterium]